MADDEQPDARDPVVAGWLEVEPLDELTRRRLVTTGLRETAEPVHRPSRAWRWVAAAAAIVVVAAGTLAIVTAKGGHDEQQASTPVRTPSAASAAPKSLATVPNVGDFGNLDDSTNLVKLRSALGSAAGSSFASDASRAESSGRSAASPAVPSSVPSCAVGYLPGDTPVAQGTGTLDGRAAIVELVVHADGSRSVEAILADPCEVRSLGTG